MKHESAKLVLPFEGLDEKQHREIIKSYGLQKLPSRAKLNKWVSAASKYGEPKWDMRSWTPDRPGGMIIYFDIVNAVGESLLDPHFASLLESYKDYLCYRFSISQGGKRRSKPQTIISDVRGGDVHLLRWMMTNRILRFADLTKSQLLQFLSEMKTLPIRNGKSQNKSITPAGLVNRVMPVDNLYFYREHLNDAIQFDAFDGKDVAHWSKYTVRYREGRKTEKIPDAVAKDLVKKAVNYITENGAAIIERRERIEAAREGAERHAGTTASHWKKLSDYALKLIDEGEDWPRLDEWGRRVTQGSGVNMAEIARLTGVDRQALKRGKTRKYLDKLIDAVVRKDRDACIYVPEAVAECTREAYALAKIKELGFADLDAVERFENRLLAACIIVVAFFTGMRASEILSLQHSDDPQQDCLRFEEITINGSKFIANWVHGTMYKTERDTAGRPCRWMTSPAAVQAINTARRLTAHIRKKLGVSHVFASQDGRNQHNNRLADRTPNQWIKNFYRDMKVEKHLSKGEEVDWNLTMHQFRRTYARFMAGTKYGLKFLQDQFQHASYLMTMWYALGDLDEDLIADINAEAVKYPKEMARKLLESDTEFSGGGATEWNEMRLRYIGKTTEQEREDYLSAVASTLVMYDNGIGICVYNPRKALCTGGAGSAPKCIPSKCGNAVIDIPHAPIHIATLDSLKKLLKSKHCQSSAQQAVIKEKLENTLTILKPLSGVQLETVKQRMADKGLIDPQLTLDAEYT